MLKDPATCSPNRVCDRTLRFGRSRRGAAKSAKSSGAHRLIAARLHGTRCGGGTKETLLGGTKPRVQALPQFRSGRGCFDRAWDNGNLHPNRLTRGWLQLRGEPTLEKALRNDWRSMRIRVFRRSGSRHTRSQRPGGNSDRGYALKAAMAHHRFRSAERGE